MDLLLKNIGLLATPLGSVAHRGKDQNQISLVEDAMVGIKDGKIVYAGKAGGSMNADEVVDCGGRLVTPGLVDAHTHLVFGGWRQKEMGLKLQGMSYLDILKSGGGILSTVKMTRGTSEEDLYQKGKGLLWTMLRHGTTSCECKSGYGLSLADELKQLRVARRLAEAGIVRLVPTFLGAHAIPEEYKENRQAFIDLVVNEMLPVVAREKLAEFCDIFCETAVFTPEESEYILGKAKALGFGLKAHVDEIDPIGGAEMTAKMGCISAEHLIQASDQGIKDMARAGVVAALLPATSFYLDKPYARARTMIEEGVAVAVATDFNPGSSPNLNLQLPMNLACLKYKLTPAEALCAVTLNAAAAIGRAGTIGTLEPGKAADVVVWDAPDLEYIFYRYGNNLVNTVVQGGRVYKN